MNATQTTNSTRKEETMDQSIDRIQTLVNQARRAMFEFNVTRQEKWFREADSLLDEIAESLSVITGKEPPPFDP